MSSAGPGRREVAHRIFAAEYDDATLEYAESDEERAPNYVVTPSGARVNRLFVVGVLTAVEQVNDDTIRARIVDPTGAFVVYAGQYQPDELAALQSMESPAFVALTGKANTFSPEGSDRVLTSVRPESVTEVDAETRDRWVVTTAEHTLARIQTIAGALEREERGEELRAALLREDVDPGLAEGIAKALDHYDTTADYLGALRDLASQALEVVAGERSEVEALEMAPDEGDGTVAADDLTDLMPEDRQSATQAAENVDLEALLESEASGAGQSAASESAVDAADDDAEDGDADDGDEEAAASTADEEIEPDSTASSAEEPVTDERAVEETAADAEEASESETAPETEEEEDEGEGESGAEPETSESAAAETASDAEAAAEADAGSEEAGNEDDAETYEVDEEEREEIEEEYGVEFQSGTEVDPAGEAGIETEDQPPIEEESADESESTADDADETPTEGEGDDADAAEEAGEEDESDEGGESDEDVDLEAALLEEMDALDDGEGADREALQAAVAEETGADAEAIDDAIDELLMSGQCYEPSEGTLKPI